jgi:hypothetical protein
VNLRALANRATQAVNPNITVQWRKYLDYDIGPNGKPVVTYAEPVGVVAQVQALSKSDVQHLDAMNLSECTRAAYVNGQMQAFDRLKETGGDMLFFEDQWWKVMAILEGWTTAGWCRVGLTAQPAFAV